MNDREGMVRGRISELQSDPRVVLRTQSYVHRDYGKRELVQYEVPTWARYDRRHGEHRRVQQQTGMRVVVRTEGPRQTRSTREGYAATLRNRTGFGRTPTEAYRALAELTL